MFGALFLLFTVVPAVELYLLIQVGTRIGAGNTLAIVIVTGFLGAWFVRLQGLGVCGALIGRAPGVDITYNLARGFLLLVGGVMLITPGFLTDILGLSLALPWTAYFWMKALRRFLQHQVTKGSVRVVTHGGFVSDPADQDEPAGFRDVTPRGH